MQKDKNTGRARSRKKSIKKEYVPLALNVKLSHALLRPGTPEIVWALVELEAPPKPPEKAARLPVNVALVLDRSGSMSGEPLEKVKRAARFVVDHMGPEDTFSLTVFDDQVETLFHQGTVTRKEILRSAISGIRAGNTTNLSGGFLRGCNEVLKKASAGHVNRLILLTDGMANVGVTDPELLAAKAKSVAEKGVTVSAVGVGTSFNEDLLIAMSEAGRGNYYYVKNPDEIPAVFSTELSGLLKITAQDVRVSLKSEAGEIRTVIGYEEQLAPGSSPEATVLNLPDMYESEKRVLVVETAVPPLPHSRPELFSVTVEYADVLHGVQSGTVSVSVSVPVADGPDELYRPDVTVRKIVELTRTAAAKDRMATSLDDGNLHEIQAGVKERIDALKGLGLPSDPEVTDEIHNLESLLDRFEPELNDVRCLSELRKDLRYQSYVGRRGSRTPQTGTQPRPRGK